MRVSGTTAAWRRVTGYLHAQASTKKSRGKQKGRGTARAHPGQRCDLVLVDRGRCQARDHAEEVHVEHTGRQAQHPGRGSVQSSTRLAAREGVGSEVKGGDRAQRREAEASVARIAGPRWALLSLQLHRQAVQRGGSCRGSAPRRGPPSRSRARAAFNFMCELRAEVPRNEHAPNPRRWCLDSGDRGGLSPPTNLKAQGCSIKVGAVERPRGAHHSV